MTGFQFLTGAGNFSLHQCFQMCTAAVGCHVTQDRRRKFFIWCLKIQKLGNPVEATHSWLIHGQRGLAWFSIQYCLQIGHRWWPWLVTKPNYVWN